MARRKGELADGAHAMMFFVITTMEVRNRCGD